nr:hypothetical protein Caab_012 [Calliteara abietis nucleopolyhedrovirus]
MTIFVAHVLKQHVHAASFVVRKMLFGDAAESAVHLRYNIGVVARSVDARSVVARQFDELCRGFGEPARQFVGHCATGYLVHVRHHAEFVVPPSGPCAERRIKDFCDALQRVVIVVVLVVAVVAAVAVTAVVAHKMEKSFDNNAQVVGYVERKGCQLVEVEYALAQAQAFFQRRALVYFC